MVALALLSVFAVSGSVLTTAAEAQAPQNRDDGFNDWGLFGLLGLAGLAGLRRNRNDNDNRNRAEGARVTGGRVEGTRAEGTRVSRDRTDGDDDVDVRRKPSAQ